MGNNGRLLNWKTKILESGILKRQNDRECICYCPWCGERKGKCYIQMVLDDETPMLYHCFICQESGVVGSVMLEKLGISNFQESDTSELDNINRGNSNGFRKQIKASNGDIECNLENYSTFDISNYNYLKNRFDIVSEITSEKMLSWCVVGDIRKYLKDVGFKDVNTKIKLENRIWFRLKNGNVAGRLMTGNGERWMIISNPQNNHCQGSNVYVMGNLFNLASRTIRIWMCEGITDLIGLNNKLEQVFEDSDSDDNFSNVFIAVMGRMYSSGFEWLIGRGIFGKSIDVRIVCDDDYTDIKNRIRKYEKCFHSIKVMKNMIHKDCGVPADQIELGYV